MLQIRVPEVTTLDHDVMSTTVPGAIGPSSMEERCATGVTGHAVYSGPMMMMANGLDGSDDTSPVSPVEDWRRKAVFADDSCGERTWKQKEAEMEAKLNWVRDQIKVLKEQDQSLMRQFLDLRAVINQIKMERSGSVSDMTVFDSGFDDQESDDLPFENVPCRRACNSSLKEDEDLPSFRPRTVSLTESTKAKVRDLPRTVMQTKEVFF